MDVLPTSRAPNRRRISFWDIYLWMVGMISLWMSIFFSVDFLSKKNFLYRFPPDIEISDRHVKSFYLRKSALHIE